MRNGRARGIHGHDLARGAHATLSRRDIARRLAVATAAAALAAAACADHTTSTEPTPTPVVTSRFAVGLPAGWGGGPSESGSRLQVGTDSGIVHGGVRSASIRSVDAGVTAGQFASFGQTIRADDYRGKRVRLRGWVRAENVTNDGAGLWLRIDGLGAGLALDNSQGRRLTGTVDWRQLQIVLDVPQEADALLFGGIMIGGGQSWYDDFTVDVVGADVPTTTAYPLPPSTDSTAIAAQRAAYARSPRTSVDLDFEGVAAAALDAGAVAWLTSSAVAFGTVDPAADLGDLAPLGKMIGDAHLVALGEATHGTREFFQMKHRVLEYLVTQKGFTAFAIEASWPEANAVDLYVRTGQGDPAVLLSNLYFWTWNTQEVLDMIRWMRSYNVGVSPDRQVRFFGFDMQAPGAAIDSASAFVRRADAAQSAAVDSAYACLAPYRNVGARFSSASYSAASTGVQAACSAAVARPYALLAGAAARYTAATSAAEYARALQSARLVVQWEDRERRTSYAASNATRDRYMAENIGWLRGQLPAGARMMVWAHNLHVTRAAGWMGSLLAANYGADYVNAAFAFGAGSFNAYPGAWDGAVTGPLGPQTAPKVVPGSFEAYATAVGAPRFLLDARQIPGASAAAAFGGPILMRDIGAVFIPTTDASVNNYAPVFLPGDYDLVIYLQTTTASQLLPFRFQ